MKKYLNNKGSTMILLVMAIAVISLLGTSILGVTMMNLKIKKTNTEIKQSFYLSESGLDKSYSKAYELVQEAVELSNDEAKSFIEKFRPENMDYLVTNYLTFLNPIYELGADGLDHLVGYFFDEEKIKLEAEKRFKDYYKGYILTSNYNGKGNLDIVTKLEGTYENISVNITNDVTPLTFAGDELHLDIDSKYTNPNNIQKTTAVELIVKVPEYNEPYTVSTEVIPVNPFWTKLLTAKNLSINSDAKFNGNVYISEDLNVDGTNINPNFTGKLAVKRNVNLNGENSVTNVKDLYSNNILLFGNGAKLLADCSGSIESGAGIYVKDDLEINNLIQEVIINGSYYGFSNGEAGPDTSSGININNTNTSSIKLEIKDDVYLNGTSYVDLRNSDGEKYQTGESISIKGNYRAYMEPLMNPTIVKDSDNKVIYNEDLTKDNVNFKDYEYLSFVDSIKIPNDRLNYEDKAFYMYCYNEEYKSYPELKLNLPTTIKLGDVHSIGNTISEGNLKLVSFQVEDNEIYKKAKENYYFETQRLGDESISYDEDKPEDTVIEFDNEIILLTDNDGDGNYDPININEIKDENGDGIKELTYVSYMNSGDLPYLLSGGKYEGLIVTNGDVKISGDVDFTGSIICGGDIIIIDDSIQKTFKYDKNIVSKVIAEYDLYKTVFKSNTSSKPPITVTTYIEEDGEDDSTVNVDFSRLLKFNDWKIK